MQKKKYVEFVGCGRNRIVFRRGNYVFKLPLNIDGFHNNLNEAFRYLKYKKDGYAQYARCKLIESILVMEYVEPSYDFKNLPDWCYAIDGMQVGYNKKNFLVAYDYG